MNEPPDKTETPNELHTLKPRLNALIQSWRASAAKQRTESAVDARLIETFRQRGEVFEQCAEALENLINGHERAIRSEQLKQFHTNAPAKPADRILSARKHNKSQKDRIVDAVVLFIFLAIIAGCGYFIIRLITRWNIKGLGY